MTVAEPSPSDDQVEQVDISSLPPQRTTSHTARDKTASHLARVIVWTFAISIGISFLFAGLDYFLGQDPSDRNVNSSLEIFKTVSSVMSGPLGFVLGFYFRESSQ